MGFCQNDWFHLFIYGFIYSFRGTFENENYFMTPLSISESLSLRIESFKFQHIRYSVYINVVLHWVSENDPLLSFDTDHVATNFQPQLNGLQYLGTSVWEY